MQQLLHNQQRQYWDLRRSIGRKTGCAWRSSVWTYKRKRNRDATGMLRIISGQTLDIYEEFCACFIDWQKAFECVNWTKLIQILSY